MGGLDANEIDWYHLIQEEYRNAGVDGTMVILSSKKDRPLDKRRI